jgi:hypothetical protein
MDDLESIETMRDCGESPPSGLALVEVAQIMDAIRVLLDSRLLQAWASGPPRGDLVPVAEPLRDASLAEYWFGPTEAGKEAWADKRSIVDAYWASIEQCSG